MAAMDVASAPLKDFALLEKMDVKSNIVSKTNS